MLGPVGDWTDWVSIRMMLILSVIYDLYITSIHFTFYILHFTFAFPQTKTDIVIFLEVPIGFYVPDIDYVCLLLMNLYGLKQAAKTYLEHLRDTLILSEEEGGYDF